jgi:DNA-binding transcriptional ArsR family regulator
MEEPVTIIDRDVLKVLSVDTRMDIIKILSEGARTPSDIGKKLHKSDATIVEHLNTMMKTGLIKKIEEPGKKWVFYTLTERGRGIISSKSRRLIIILSISLLVLLGGAFTFVNPLLQTFQASTLRQNLPAATEKSLTAGAGSSAISTTQIYQYISLIFIFVGILGLVYYVYRRNVRWRPKEIEYFKKTEESM